VQLLGDFEQAVFHYRDITTPSLQARPIEQLIMDMQQENATFQRLTLSKTFRCTKPIMALAQFTIKDGEWMVNSSVSAADTHSQSSKVVTKSISGGSMSDRDGPMPFIVETHCASQRDENASIIQKIQQLLAGGVRREDVSKKGDHSRHVFSQGLLFISALDRSPLPLQQRVQRFRRRSRGARHSLLASGQSMARIFHPRRTDQYLALSALGCRQRRVQRSMRERLQRAGLGCGGHRRHCQRSEKHGVPCKC
jgi:hypothetical protein